MPAVELVRGPKLVAEAMQVTTEVTVDIGESGSCVAAIFLGFPVTKAALWIRCGGGDETAFLDSMLMTRTNEGTHCVTSWLSYSFA